MGLFGPNKKALKRWPHLSPEDAEICWKASQGNAYKFLSIAIEKELYAVLSAVDFTIGYSSKIKLLSQAYAKKDIQAFQLVRKLSSNSWDAVDQSNMFASLAKLPPWPEGFTHALSLFPRFRVGELIDVIFNKYGEAEWPRLMSELCSVRPKDDMADIIVHSAGCSCAVFDVLFDALPINADTPSVLAKAGLELLGAKETLHPSIFDALLAKGMNVNHDKGVLLIAALKNNYLQEAQKLIDARFNLDLLGEHVRETLYSESGQPDAIDFIEQYVGKRRAVPTATQDSGFVLTAPDTVVRSIPLPDGGSLTVAFNFTLRQQIVVAQLGAANAAATAALTMIPFDMLGGPDALAAATAALKALDGDVSLIDTAGSLSRPIALRKPQVQNNVQ